ncbi:hypothetical protein Scep_021573 [Stephania cephalantha]|uniref:Uncharacterized protein n=1 Tax=Stephania cephalantha TaxID=152367 RepID=A0AAP0I1Z4_9MAGN
MEERYNNKAAYVMLQPPGFDTPVFHSFEAVTPRQKYPSIVTEVGKRAQQIVRRSISQ